MINTLFFGQNPEQQWYIGLHFISLIVKVFFRGKCYSRENMPKNGPYIGSINHSSLFDIPALTLAFEKSGSHKW